MIRPLVFAPNPVLNNKAKAVKIIDKKILSVIKDLKDTLLSCSDPPGVGLAAPQINVPLQIFIIKPTPREKIQVFINPKIIKLSKDELTEVDNTLEGCLSINNTWARVKRSKTIEIEYLTTEGQKRRQIFTNYKARIIQHELDHLQGILFTQRALSQKQKLYKIIKEEGKEKLVPLEI